MLIRSLALLLQMDRSRELCRHLLAADRLLLLFGDFQVGGTDWALALAIVHAVGLRGELLVLHSELGVVHGLRLGGIARLTDDKGVVAVLVV